MVKLTFTALAILVVGAACGQQTQTQAVQETGLSIDQCGEYDQQCGECRKYNSRWQPDLKYCCNHCGQCTNVHC
jgi:hypothetical protein